MFLKSQQKVFLDSYALTGFALKYCTVEIVLSMNYLKKSIVMIVIALPTSSKNWIQGSTTIDLIDLSCFVISMT